MEAGNRKREVFSLPILILSQFEFRIKSKFYEKLIVNFHRAFEVYNSFESWGVNKMDRN